MDFQPLLTNLQRIQLALENGQAPPIMIAARTLSEFKRQELPSQCSATPRKVIGPRVPVLGRLPEGRMRIELARWPNDCMLEGAFPSLLVVISGQADIRVADYIVHCPTGSMLYIPGGIPKMNAARPHYEEITEQSHCDVLMLTPGWVNGEGLECSICHSRGALHEYGNKDESCWVKNGLLAQLFAGFASEAENEGMGKSTFYLLSCILLLLQREIKRGGGFKSWQFVNESADAPSHDPIERALQYIDDHLATPLSIDVVARQVGFSRRAFTERFRTKTGQTFKDYLTEVRLKHASLLLCEANLPVKRVSRLVGLSPGQLRLLFHQRYQCTPGEFRVKNKYPK